MGKVLTKAKSTKAVYEPFNYHTGLQAIPSYFAVQGQPDFLKENLSSCVSEIQSLRPNLKSGVFPEDNYLPKLRKHLIGSRTKLSFLALRARFFHLQNLIWKDPFAIFNLAYLTNIPTIVLTRSPVAIAASFKRMNWAFDLETLTLNLTASGYGTHCRHIVDNSLDTQSPVINACLLWKAIYTYVISIKHEANSPHVHLFDLQDIVEAPSQNYRLMYQHLGLQWTKEADQAINPLNGQSKKRSSVPSKTKAHVKNRDISQVNEYGRELLTPSELDVIHSITCDTWAEVQKHLDSKRASHVRS